MNDNEILIECDPFDYKQHKNNNARGSEYHVVSLISKILRIDSFDYRELPLIIFHRGYQIYNNKEYIANKTISEIEANGFKVKHLAYSNKEIEFFSNKYFEVLL